MASVGTVSPVSLLSQCFPLRRNSCVDPATTTVSTQCAPSLCAFSALLPPPETVIPLTSLSGDYFQGLCLPYLSLPFISRNYRAVLPLPLCELKSCKSLVEMKVQI